MYPVSEAFLRAVQENTRRYDKQVKTSLIESAKVTGEDRLEVV